MAKKIPNILAISALHPRMILKIILKTKNKRAVIAVLRQTFTVAKITLNFSP